MQTSQYEQLQDEPTQRLSDLINGLAQVMNQRYYTLDQYATELLKALDFGDAARIEKAKSDLARFLRNQY